MTVAMLQLVWMIALTEASLTWVHCRRDRYLDPHQDDVCDDGPGKIESDHPEEDEDIGEGREGGHRH